MQIISLSFFLFCTTSIYVAAFASFTRELLAQNKTDEAALKDFKSKIHHDPEGVLNSWNDSHQFCEWEGISCSRRHRRVTILDLSSRGLYGFLSPYIGNLSFLRELILYNNSIQGEIPRYLGSLFRLKVLLLFDNSLVGEIPTSLSQCSRLTDLSLQDNNLVGKIPLEFVYMYNLKLFSLHNNNLTGFILHFLGKFTSLEVLSLAYNAFGGSIPDSLGQLRKLKSLDVSDNNLSGQIPDELGLCSNLEYLYMEGNFFNGFIPPSFRFLGGLREIDLSHNNLSGLVPKFFDTLPHLENLNVSFNGLEGEVPMKGIFANASAISVAGNGNKLCGGIAELRLPKCPNNDSTKEKVSPLFKILISIASSVLGLTLTLWFIKCWVKKEREKQAVRPMLRKTLLKVSYEQLFKATDGFSPMHLIGVGSFGSVYHGILDQNETIVAIKVFNLGRHGAFKSFMAECIALRNIRYRNLVRVVTSCSSIDFQGNDFKAIIYEFMANGSLEMWLHPFQETEEEQPEIQSLTLLQRIRIGIDVATVLDYLHHHSKETLLHCDLKPSNVLLDSDMTAHVGDFGLARFLSEVPNPDQSSSIGVKGTIGYVAPEYGLGSKVSIVGDVYSFGILLLEMVTRKRPTNTMFEGDLNLHNCARMMLPDGVMDIIDPVLVNEEIADTNPQITIHARNNSKKECLISLVRIGVACSMESPHDRMSISHVLHELQSVRDILLQSTTRPNVQIRGNDAATVGSESKSDSDKE